MSSSLTSRLTDAQNCLSTAWETKSHADIDIAVTKWGSILRDAKGGEESYDDILSSYASSLLLRWRARHRAEDIDNAIDALEKSVLRQGNVMSFARYENHCNLGAAYFDRWETLEREPSDLLAAAAKWEIAHAIALQIGYGAQSASAILPNLGDAHCLAYSRKFSEISAISRAIVHYNSALLVATPESCAKLRYKLGKARAIMFLKTHDDENLRQAYFYLQQTISSDLPNEQKEDAAIELSDIYLYEYEEKMTREPLDSAVYWVRRAIHSLDNEGSLRLLRKVASLLTLLYKGFRDTAALDSAIVCYEQAWDLRGSHETEDASTYYYNFGTALMRRSSAGYTSRQRIKDDLKRAIELLQLAVDGVVAGHSLAYEIQLKTAQEKYRNIDRSPSMRTSSLDNGSPAFLPPIRSSTMPGLIGPQAHIALTRTPPISSPLGTRSLSDVEPRNSLPSARDPGPLGGDYSAGNLRRTADTQASELSGLSSGSSAGPRPAARHQTLPYQPVGAGDPEWRLAQADVQVWNGRVLPTEPMQQQQFPIGQGSFDSTHILSASRSGAEKLAPVPASDRLTATGSLGSSSHSDPTYLSPHQPPTPPLQFPSTAGIRPSAPPSPTDSLRARFDSLSTSDAPLIASGEYGRNSSPHIGATTANSAGSSGLLADDVSTTGTVPVAYPDHQELTTESAPIKPTNLTGRIVKTDQFPVDEGGFSSIYKGAFGSTKVAIKVIRNLTAVDSATLQKRLRREMDVWWKLEHPNVVPLWGFTDDMGPLPSMISPWYQNGNASNYVQKEGLSIEFRLQLLREVSTGLRYLHHFSPPVVHGDLKPGNILIDNDGVARLCDFGLAHLVVAGAEATFTSAGNVGTIRYAAPELRCPEDDEEFVRASTQTDIYSLACIAYEFLYQKQPFADKGSIQTIIAAGYSHIPPARMESEDPSVLGPTSPHYWELFQSCWDEMPNQRPDIIAFCNHIDLAFLALAN